MGLRKVRHRLAVASTVGVAIFAATLTMSLAGAGEASASISIPAFPTFGTYPEWLPTTGTADPVNEVDQSEGSDTTLFAMESLSNLYAQAGLLPFSCALTTSPQNTQCAQPVNGVNPNNSQSDTVDNFSGTEELQGINNVGSGNGQAELCGTQGTPATSVDYARSSKPSAGTCPTEVQLGYAKDGVPAVDFLQIDPEAYGTPTGYNSITDPQCASSGAGYFPSYNYSTGAVVCTQFPTGGIGPVADGWEPGNAYNCGSGGGPACTGTPFTDVDNTGITVGGVQQGPLTSVAYRLWCAHGGSATAYQSQITDWGQLTNLTGSETAGEGAPIGVPIRIIGVNSGSGTAATFNNFAKSGGSGTNCIGTGNYNENAASGPDPEASQGPANNLEIALENDSNQIGDFANADWGPTDPADQATDIATSLYYMGNGAFNTNANASTADLEVTSSVGNLPTAFIDSETTLNGIGASSLTINNNSFPTSRTLFNIYRSDTIRASTAGFLNWICDTNPAASGQGIGGQEAKGTDHVVGGNYDQDITNIIVGTYGFTRMTDSTLELSASQQTTAGDGVVNPKAACDAQLPIASGATSGSTTLVIGTTGLIASELANVQPGWTVSIPSGYTAVTPTGTVNGKSGLPTDTVASVNDTTMPYSITLTTALNSGTGSSAPSTVYFPGHPPVLQVATPGT